MDTAVLVLWTKVKVDLLWTGKQCKTLIYVLIFAAKMISWNYSGYREKKRREKTKNKEQRTQKEKKRASIWCAEKKKTYKEKDIISGERKYLICGGDEERREKRGKWTIWTQRTIPFTKLKNRRQGCAIDLLLCQRKLIRGNVHATKSNWGPTYASCVD